MLNSSLEGKIINNNFPLENFSLKSHFIVSTEEMSDEFNDHSLLFLTEPNPINIFQKRNVNEEKEDIDIIFTLEAPKNHIKNKIVQEKSKKKGRRNKSKLTSKENGEKIKIHDRIRIDNVSQKIQVHYLSFIVSFLNEMIKYSNIKGKKEKFKKINREFKKNNHKQFINDLKNKTIGDILSEDISVKFKFFDSKHNKNLYLKYKENKLLKKIFNDNYLNLFSKIYYKSKRKISLKDYGSDLEIILPDDKIKMYKDLLNSIDKNDKNDKNDIVKYKKKINDYVLIRMLKKNIFKIEYTEIT